MSIFSEGGCFLRYLGVFELAKVFYLREKRSFLSIRGDVFLGELF